MKTKMIKHNSKTLRSALLTLPLIMGTSHAALVAHWTFDEGAGTAAADSSGNSNDATHAGAAGTWVTGKSGSAYQLGGSDSRFEVANSTPLHLTGPVSISAWVKPTAASSFGVIAGVDQTGGSANDMYTLKTNGTDNPRWEVVSGGGGNNISIDAPDTLTNYSAATADGWVLLTTVFDPGVSASFYVNGVLVGSDTSSVPTSIQLTTTDFQMGHNAADSGNSPLNAAIDEVQIYSDALTQAQVTTLFNNPGTNAVPEPSSTLLLGLGSLALLRRSRK